MKLLLVEDNVALAENLIELFSDEGFTILHAQTGREARQIAKDGFDLAIIDLRLPDISGTALLQELSQVSPEAESVLLTGDADVASAAEAVRAGAFAYLIKPIATAELLLTMERASEQVKLRKLSKELQVALKRSEEQHRNIVEKVPALIVAVDASRTVRLVNRAVEETTGYTREELEGRPFGEIFGQDAAPTETTSYERSLTNQKGQTRRILWRWTGSAEEGFYLGTDVTELRRLERARARAERLAVVGKMTAGLAHEIRNPLNAALLQLQLLSRRHEKLPKEMQTPLQGPLHLIQTELERLNILLTDFLSLAKPKEYQRVPVSLHELLSRVIALHTEVAKQRKISLKLRVEPKLRAQGDPEALQQVFVNLMKNALEAAKSAIEVGAVIHEERVIVTVEDDGTGISKEIAEHLFEPFYTTKAQGTGLGLTIVHSIVLAHGGEISLSSRAPKEGTTAKVTLLQAGD